MRGGKEEEEAKLLEVSSRAENYDVHKKTILEYCKQAHSPFLGNEVGIVVVFRLLRS